MEPRFRFLVSRPLENGAPFLHQTLQRERGFLPRTRIKARGENRSKARLKGNEFKRENIVSPLCFNESLGFANAASQQEPTKIKTEDDLEEAQAENKSYLSTRDGLETQDPDELMITDECEDSENIKPDIKDNESSDVKEKESSEHGSLDASQQPPDLFTGTFQEDSTNAHVLDRPPEEADVYLATPDSKFPQSSLSGSLKDRNDAVAADTCTDVNKVTSDETGLNLSDAEVKSSVQDDREMQILSDASVISTSQESQSTETPVVTMQAIENQGGQLYQQQPTYVLLQTTGDQDGNGQPQVFLAMQTGSVSGQDSQAYITLHPVSVEGQEITGALSTEGLNLQQAVFSQSGISGDVSLELNPHVSLADVKGLQLSSVSDASSQMYIPASGHLVTSSDGDPTGSGVITYIQPVNSMSGGHTQVLMAVAEDESETLDNGNSVRIRAKEAATIAGNLIGVPVPIQPPSPPAQGQKQVQGAQNAVSVAASAQSRRRLSNDPRTCDECGRSFKYPSDLKKHLQIHTDMKKFQCDECCRCFRRLHQLNVHKRIHSGEKPYSCNRCGAQFRHDSTLTMHIRTRHDHLKPFSCEGCGKNFGRMSHLRKHQRNVCGKGTPRYNLFSCKFCDEEFNRKSDLRQHFLNCEKKPEKPDKDVLAPTIYSCDHCGKEFSRNYDFKRHQLSHTDEKPYPCSHCAKNFKEKSSLYKHVKRMHSSLAGESFIDGSQDESNETEAAQQAIATITSSHDAIVATCNSNDIIVSLAQSISSSTDSDTVATAHALAQAGIIDNPDQILHGSHTIAAADILNFPEVAAALGLNPGSQSEHRTMVVTQPVDAPSMITMDGEHVRMQDTGLEEGITDQPHIEASDASAIKQFASTTVALQLDTDGLIIDTGENSLNPNDEPMINVSQEQISASTASHLHSSNGVPSISQTIAGDLLKTGLGGILSGADAERVAASVGSSQRVEMETETRFDNSKEPGVLAENEGDDSDKDAVSTVNSFEAQAREIPMSIG
ncbi:uncharacterized protein LOC135684528 isoform X1 [Rhopilema esculentum]|uniref:uncharacterized protein LOC135684528 isoform X1 n=1 Tax=Rhopilema esculentum TaxID=499914 RepID=UPI0031CE3D84